jgi:uracil phosphoribosyltransferase
MVLDQPAQGPGAHPEVLQEVGLTGPGGEGLLVGFGVLLLTVLLLVRGEVDVGSGEVDVGSGEVDVGSGGEQLAVGAVRGGTEIGHEQPRLLLSVHPGQGKPLVLMLDHGQHGLVVNGHRPQRIDELVEGLRIVHLDVARLPGPTHLGNDSGEVRHGPHRGTVGGPGASHSAGPRLPLPGPHPPLQDNCLLPPARPCDTPSSDRLRDMRLHVVDHPLVSHKLTVLRNRDTDSPTFRRLADELVTLLAYEATRHVRAEPCEILTPVARAVGVKLSAPKPLVVPILRAGLGMLDGMTRLVPTAEVGFLGMLRNEQTLQASTYATRLPDDLSGRQVFLLDPMLATGGTLSAAMRFVFDRGADNVTAICLLAAPEGVAEVERRFGPAAPVTIIIAGLDDQLNELGYIIPGLGDAGDRMYGIA